MLMMMVEARAYRQMAQWHTHMLVDLPRGAGALSDRETLMQHSTALGGVRLHPFDSAV